MRKGWGCCVHVISYFTLISPLHAYNSDLGCACKDYCHFAVLFMRFAIWYYLKRLTARLFVMKKCSPITIFGILHSMDITSFEVVVVLIRIFRISVRVTRKVGPHFQVYAQGSGRSKYYLNNLKQKCLREKLSGS
jgi:hypothetical protein